MSLQLIKSGLIAALLAAAVSTAAARETTAPDILLISGDDLGAYLGCYGDPFVRTPHMDKIAADGVRFDNAWVAQASCSPSRSAIMTGLYPHQNGQIGLAHRGFSMSGDFPSIPSLLNEAGYFTGLVGKHHIKPESSFPYKFRWDVNGVKNRDPDLIGEQVARFLTEAGNEPFFLHTGLHDPHRPLLEQVEGYPADPLTSGEVELLPFMKGLEDVPGLLDDVAGYYNCIMRMDDCVGSTIDALKKAGRFDNTMIIVIGDHGAPFGRAKVTSYNPGLRIPFIVKWPKVAKAGSASTALVSTVDILPTMLDAAGVKYDGTLAGTSLRPVVENPDANVREFMFGEFTAHLPADYHPNRTVRSKKFQLIHYLQGAVPNPTPGIEGLDERNAIKNTDLGTSRARAAVERYMNPPEYELFDLEKDPENFVNLAGQPEYAEIEKTLKAELMKWRKETKDPLLEPGAVERLGSEIKSTLDLTYTGALDHKEEEQKSKKRRKRN